MGQHVKSKADAKFGAYEIHIGGAVVDDKGTVEDSDVFTYDVNKDEQGADVIVNFGRLEDKKAEAGRRKAASL